jgi:hypothetical protein
VNAGDHGQPYANPYLSGLGLGLVLLASFVLAGRGLGATGAFGSAAAGLAGAVAPQRAAGSPYFLRHLEAPGGPWRSWLLVEVIGVAIGGCLSAARAGRWRIEVERGGRVSTPSRLAFAFAGGATMGLGAVLARGCTSGQALTGGALLSVGGWTFMAATFISAYLVALPLKSLWR